MERPHHGAPDPDSHPRIATEAAHPGAGSRRCRNAIQMYAAACSRTWSVTPKHHGDVPTKGHRRLRRFLPLSCLFVSGAPHRSIIAGKFTQIPQNPCQPMTSRPPRTHGLYLGDVNEKASGRIPEELLLVLRHKMAAMRDSTHRGCFSQRKTESELFGGWIHTNACKPV